MPTLCFENKELTPIVSQPTTDRCCYTVADLQKILGISRGSVYELLKRQEFKWFQIGGNRYRISKKSFDAWLDEKI